MKIDHIGIASQEGEKLATLYERHFGARKGQKTVLESLGFMSQFMYFDKGKIEILQPTRPDGIIGRFLENRGRGGIHHISLRVTNLEEMVALMKQEQYTFIDTIKTYDDGERRLKYIFINPKCTDGVLLELQEAVEAD